MAEILGEFKPDATDLETGLIIADNVIARGKHYEAVKAFASFSSALPAEPIGGIAVLDNTGNSHVFIGTTTKLYKLNTSNGFDDITRISGGNYNTSSKDKWYFEKFDNDIIATNYADNPQVYNLNTSTNFADLGGTPPKGRVIGEINNFLILGDTDDTEGQIYNRIRWCGIGDITEWSDIDQQADSQLIRGDGGNIKGIVGFGNYGYIFQEKAISRVVYNGSPIIFGFTTIEKTKGVKIASSIVTHGKSVFYIGDDGFYELREGQIIPIGLNKVDKYFWDNVNKEYLHKVSASTTINSDNIRWSFPTINSANGVPDKILVYNLQNGRWTTITQSIYSLFVTRTLGKTLEDLDAIADLDNLPYSLDSDVWKGGDSYLSAFSTDYKLGYFDGSEMTATIETKDYSFNEDNKTLINKVEPLIEGGNASVEVGYRNKINDTVNYGSLTPQNSEGFCNVRIPNSFYHRFKFTITSGFSKFYGFKYRTKITSRR